MDFFDQLQELARPTVNKKPWMNDYELILAKTEDLAQIEQECIASKLFALDIETSGLDARVFPQEDGSKCTNDKIVGVCIAPNAKKSYYIPVRHREEGSDANVPVRLVGEMIRNIKASGAVTVFHNGKFDIEFLEHDPSGPMGSWDDPDCWDDTLILAYLNNSREKRRGLKHLAKTLLEREMIELDELFPKDSPMDFGLLDPRWEPVVWYAAADALNTLALREILHPLIAQKDQFGNSQNTVYKIEKLCVTATRWMERNRVPVDRGVIEKLIKIGQREWIASIFEVYKEVNQNLERDARPGWVRVFAGDHHKGHILFDPDQMSPTYMEARSLAMDTAGVEQKEFISKSVPSITDPKVRETVQFPKTYDVTIPAELGLLLRELGVEGLRVTEKSGQVQTSKDELNRVIEESGDDYPFMILIKKFREVAKGLSSNLFPVYTDLSPERSPDQRLWIAFNGFTADTGRFSTPGGSSDEFTGQCRWNLQSIPSTADKSKPECVTKMRSGIKAKPGKILFAIDYSNVELRIATSLSKEQKWVEQFFKCSGCGLEFDRDSTPPSFCPDCGSDKIGDLHTLTAQAIYGEDCKDKPDFKSLRGNAKALNFSLCYGGGGSAAQRSVGVDKEEGWRIKRQFDKTYRGLTKWWESLHRIAREQKYVTTAYGRKYPLPDIDHPDGGFRSKAERNATNGPVQGTSADIMKFAMGLIYRECKKLNWLEKVKLCITIHDELVFEIDEDVAEEAVYLINELMTVRTIKNLRPQGWPIPLKNDIEFGDDWTAPFNLIAMSNTRETKPQTWSERWVRVFPKTYAIFLGQTPPEPVEEAVKEVAAPPIPAVKEPAYNDVAEASGDFVFKISRSRLTPSVAQVLARVVQKCTGRGLDRIRIETDDGIDLLGSSFVASFKEFKVIASYEGL
jgi:DNA polymerase I-like protein with 3'-5' exonuclease and polymerase domains